MAIIIENPNIPNGKTVDAQIISDTIDTVIDANKRSATAEAAAISSANSAERAEQAAPSAAAQAVSENLSAFQQQVTNAEESARLAQEAAERAAEAGGVSIYQTTGDSETGVMSQKAVTTKLESKGSQSTTFTIGFTDDCDYKITTASDHQNIINQAITDLPNNGGKIVLREGVYLITNNININKANVTIEGMGGSTKLRRAASFQNGIIYLTSENGSVTRLYIDGYYTTYPDTFNYGILCASSSKRNAISFVFIDNTYWAVNNLSSCRINDNIFQLNRVDIYNNGTNCTITSNQCFSNIELGIYLLGNLNVATGNVCNGGRTGIAIAGSNVVTGNTCSSNSSYGIQLYGSYNSTVVGNICLNNDSGIVLQQNSMRNNISGNTCMRGTGASGDYTSTQHTISIESGSTNNLVTSNLTTGKAVTNNGGATNTLANNKN